MQENSNVTEEYLNMTVPGIVVNSFMLLFNNSKIMKLFASPFILCIVMVVSFLITFAHLLRSAFMNNYGGAINVILIICAFLFAVFAFLALIWKYAQAIFLSIRCTKKLLCGQTFEIKEEREYIKPKMAVFFGITFCLILLCIALFISNYALLVGVIAPYGESTRIMLLVPIVIEAAFFIFLFLPLLFSCQVYAFSDDIGPIKAIIRSFKIICTKRLILSTVGLLLVFFLLILIVQIGVTSLISVPMSAITRPAAGHVAEFNSIFFLLFLIMSAILKIAFDFLVVYPAFNIAITHLYLRNLSQKA